MQKWKRGYRSVKKIQPLNAETGVTLVELLAAITIFGVIVLLGGAIHMFGQRQFASQTESASQTTDLNQTMTVLSKNLRRKRPTDVIVDDNVITVFEGPVYKVKNGKLYQNTIPLVESVTSFTAEKPTPETDHIKISIKLASDKPGVTDKHQQTTIYFRGEPEDEASEEDLE